jgi:predicted metal-dependent phosphoesterase TrpH
MRGTNITRLPEKSATGHPLPIRIDLHVHTRRYSACAPSLALEQIVAVLNRGWLDGVVLTDHDVLWPRVEIQALNAKLQRGRIYRGIEASSCNGHFLLIGVENMGAIHPGDPIETLQSAAHGQGAAVIWAHPQQRYSQITQPLAGARLPVGIDAIEVASTVTTDKAASAAQRLARRHGLPMVAGSDAHCAAAVGQALTRFAELPADEGALAEMIRRGHCAPHVSDPILKACS